MMKRSLTIILLSIFAYVLPVFAQEAEERETLSLDKFIELACEKDQEFERILIDNLELKYKKKLTLPADDIVLSAKNEYVAFVKNQEKGYPVYDVSLSKLFPYTGTELEAGYSSTAKSTSLDDIDAEFYTKISQSVARNAFGRSTRLLDKITGLEIDTARYQIVEAYELYLSSIIQIYYDWYEAYENVKTAENSYNKSRELLKNVEDRAKNNIALPVDVNKVKLQVLQKEETLITVRRQYDEYTNLLEKSMRNEREVEFLPDPTDQYDGVTIDFDEDYKKFKKESRTSMILDMLEEKSDLTVYKDADDLLPSIDLYAEYSITADDRDLERDNKKVMAGVVVEYPFPGQVEHAEYETSKVEHKKSVLDKINTHISLYAQLKNLYEEIEKTRKIIKIAEEKIKVSQSIVDDDAINYSYGKVILNNFIDEVNSLDSNKFSKIQYSITLKKLIVDWLTLTDQLIRKKDLKI